MLMLTACNTDDILVDDDTDNSVTLIDPDLAWSESSYEATIGESNSFPTLTNKYNLTVSYASSDNSVATISSSGAITLVAEGVTVISASSKETAQYESGAASYRLIVKKKGSTWVDTDDGAVNTVFDSSGDNSSDDDISNTTFTRLVTVTYASGGASVTGYSAVADVMNVSVSGNQVTITYTGSENVAYKLTGTASNGSFKLYSSKKQALWLSGLNLTCTSGAAIMAPGRSSRGGSLLRAADVPPPFFARCRRNSPRQQPRMTVATFTNTPKYFHIERSASLSRDVLRCSV